MRFVLMALALGQLGLLSPSLVLAADQPQTTTLDRLTELASSEQQHPQAVFDLGIRAVPVSDLISPENTTAHETLEQVLARTHIEPPPQNATASSHITAQDHLEATRLYVEAKTRLANDDLNRAISLLEQAAARDPVSPTLLAELGQARVRAGRMQTGLAVLDRAVTLGDRTTGTLYTLARLRLDRGEIDRALPIFVAARESIGAGVDPALPPLISASLGLALLQQGSILAGSEAILESLRFPVRLRSTTEYLTDYGDWVRQRKSLLTRGANGFWRVGEVLRAAQLYAMADDSGTFNPDDLLTRLVAAHAAAGHPASAAIVILRAISTLDRPATERQIRLLTILTQHSDLAPELVAALDSLLALPDPKTPSLRSGLVLAKAACQSQRHALETLRASSSEPWASPDVLRRWLEAEPDPRSVAKHALRIVESTPAHAATIAKLLFLARADPAAVYDSIRTKDSLPAQLLATQIALEVHRPDLVPDKSLDPTSTLEFYVAGAQAVAAAARGDWAAYTQSVSRLANAPRCPPLVLAQVYAGGQRFDDAIGILQSQTHDLRALVISASISRVLGNLEQAAGTLEQAIQIDPTDESLHQELLKVLTSQAEKSPELGQVLRRIRVSIPSGRLIRQLMAQNLEQSGMLPQALTWLTDLLDDGAPEDEILPLLDSVWRKLRDKQASTESLDRRVEQLTASHKESPGSVSIATVLAGLLVAQDSPARAIRVLEQTAKARLDSPEISRAIERLLQTELHKPEEAEARARGRLDRPSLGIDESLERAELLAEGGTENLKTIVQQVLEALPESAQLTPTQQFALSTLTEHLAARASKSPDDDAEQTAVAALADFVLARGIVLSPSQHERRIRTLSAHAKLDRVIRACGEAVKQYPNLVQQIWLLAGQSLIDADRAAEAAMVLAEGVAQIGDPINTELVRAMIRTAGNSGSLEQIGEIVSRLEKAEIILPVVESVSESFSIPAGSVSEGASPERVRAEFAYLVSLIASSAGRETQADELLELAIKHDPTHPWAANDLGYKIAESGENLERAEALLVAAAKELPDRGSVLDSLGWLRYKLGVLDNDGETEGAIALLTRASQQPDGQTNATIYLHLGDALWRFGNTKDARTAWATALGHAQDQQRLATQNQAAPRVLSGITQELQSIQNRLKAADDDDPTTSPPTAPIPGLDSSPNPTLNP